MTTMAFGLASQAQANKNASAYRKLLTDIQFGNVYDNATANLESLAFRIKVKI